MELLHLLGHYFKTVRKILRENSYEIPLLTLTRICEAKEIKISSSFKLLDL